MRVWNTDTALLRVLKISHKLPPRKCHATFIVKATYRLDLDGGLEPLGTLGPTLPPLIRYTMGPEELENWPELPCADKPVGGTPPLGDIPTDHNELENEFAPFKPRADVIVLAKAHAPNGKPVKALEVALTIGDHKKALHIVGDHWWIDGRLTEFQPFTVMPVSWERAYGGPGYARNPVGKGFEITIDPRGRQIAQMPNLHYPRQAIGRPGLSHQPAGFGPLGRSWEQRVKDMMGTYDETWRREQWPWYPKDFDWSHYNCAPRDQQVEGYLKGDETLSFHNLHAERPRIETRLPGIRPRLFFKEFIDVSKPRPDREAAPSRPPSAKPAEPPTPATLTLPPPSDAAVEALGKASSKAPFVDLDKTLAGLPGPDDAAKLLKMAVFPKPAPPDPEAPMAPMPGIDDPPGAFRWREVALNLDTVVVDLERMRVTLCWRAVVKVQTIRMREVTDVYATHEPMSAPPRDKREHLADLDRVKDEVRRSFNPNGVDALNVDEDIERQVEEAEATLKAMLAEAGRLGNQTVGAGGAVVADVALPETPPPAGGGAATGALRKEMADHGGPTGGAAADAITGLASAAEAGKLTAHPAMAKPKAETLALVDTLKAERQAVVAKLEAQFGKIDGEAFSTRGDFVRAVDEGKDLRACNAFRLDLSGLDLSGLDLTRANLAYADLTGARLIGTKLATAIFFKAKLVGADFSQAVLDNASFFKAVFGENRFVGASVGMAVFAKANLDGADFSRAHGAKAMFAQASLRAARFLAADLPQAEFFEARLADADFTGAKLYRGSFISARARRARFDEVEGELMMGNLGADFRKASFRNARLPRANFEQSILGKADFSGAVLTNGLFAEARAVKIRLERADLADAMFDDTNLRKAYMVEANLARAVFDRTLLRRADLSGANLYRTLFIHTELEETVIGGAFIKGSMLERMVRA